MPAGQAAEPPGARHRPPAPSPHRTMYIMYNLNDMINHSPLCLQGRLRNLLEHGTDHPHPRHTASHRRGGVMARHQALLDQAHPNLPPGPPLGHTHPLSGGVGGAGGARTPVGFASAADLDMANAGRGSAAEARCVRMCVGVCVGVGLCVWVWVCVCECV